MDKKTICHGLEIARFAGFAGGIALAHMVSQNPVEQFTILSVIAVVSIAGLTGVESVFLGKTAAEISGYQDGGGGYQRQSGLNNLATAITALLVYLLNWGFYACASVTIVMMSFLTLSAANHAFSAMREKNRSLKNFLRPIMTALLLIILIPYLLRALQSLD